MIISTQVSEPCSLRNTCPLLGSHRRHSGFIRFLLGQRTHNRVQVKDTWDALKAYTIGGKNPLFCPFFLLPPSHLLFRYSRSRSWHAAGPPYSIYKRNQRPSPWCHSQMDGLRCYTHDFNHEYIYTGKQFECVGYRGRFRWSCSGIFHHLCSNLLSATATSTGARPCAHG
jgi:hypothetical protein